MDEVDAAFAELVEEELNFGLGSSLEALEFSVISLADSGIDPTVIIFAVSEILTNRRAATRH